MDTPWNLSNNPLSSSTVEYVLGSWNVARRLRSSCSLVGHEQTPNGRLRRSPDNPAKDSAAAGPIVAMLGIFCE